MNRKGVKALTMSLIAVIVLGGVGWLVIWICAHSYGPWMARRGQPLVNAIYEYKGACGHWPDKLMDIFDRHPELRKLAGWHYVDKDAYRLSNYARTDWAYARQPDGGFKLFTLRLFSNHWVLYYVGKNEGGEWTVFYADKGFVPPPQIPLDRPSSEQVVPAPAERSGSPNKE
jgi:hypothetical protein